MIFFLIYIAALGVAFNEQEADYSFMFNSLNAYFIETTGKGIEPEFLMCDAAHAISNAFINCFTSSKNVLMCWAHASSNIYKRTYKKTVNRDKIKEDIIMLQMSPSEEIFKKGIQLLNKKWNKKEREFMKYLNEEWVVKNPNWFGGANLSMPNTNNCLESFNNNMKNHQTLRKRMTIVEFKSFILDIVSQRSLEYKHGHKIYVCEASITDHMWIQAYNLSKMKQIKIKKIENSTKYYISAGDKKEITENDIDSARNLNWNSLEEFEQNVFSIWEVVLFDNSDWQKGTCTCPVFQKKFMCKHLLSVAIRTKKTKAPTVAKTTALEPKRKRGRPKKSKKALMRE